MEPSLLVLAAGIGSRYGGLKQLDSFGPFGENIIDYSIFDAIRIGCKKVVFIIREEFETDFKGIITNKFEDKIAVSFAYQEMNRIPKGIAVPAKREKPWGTAHAVLVAMDKITEPFMVINADDYYGAESFGIGYNFLLNLDEQDEQNYCIVGYKLANTLSEYGSVSRGICEMDEMNYLKSLTERTKIFRKEDGIFFEDNDGTLTRVQGDTMVSMNLMGFTPSIFCHLESYFENFLHEHIKDLKREALLPTVVNEVVHTGRASVKILPTSSSWFGVTYQKDKELVRKKIMDLHQKGVYPKRLWS